MALPEMNSPTRPVRILAAGGTIAMTGREDGAKLSLDAEALAAAVGGLNHIESETVANLPSAHLTPADQLRIARAARDAARSGFGVVVTGAIRPASAPGADGPANIADAVAVAQSEAAGGMGVLVVFGGEIHHARCARKTDTTSLTAFSSPQTGPLGRVSEGHPTIWSRIPRNPFLDPPDLDRRVLIVPTTAGDDGTLARAALDTNPDGVVIGTLGAGHLHPTLM